jgi:hypothetical protein
MRASRGIRPVRMALLAALVAAGGNAGCGGKQKSKPADSAPETVIVVLSGHKTNDARPFYVLVRNVDLKTYLAEPYAAVAAKVITPDESVLAAEVIFPGRRTELRLRLTEDATPSVYFLFTEPGSPWKTRIEQPVPGKIELALGDDRILEAEE